MSEDGDARRMQVWAVEYTTVTGERSVAIMESQEVAVAWVENLVRNSWADPVLLQGTAVCRPTDELTSVPACGKFRTA